MLPEGALALRPTSVPQHFLFSPPFLGKSSLLPTSPPQLSAPAPSGSHPNRFAPLSCILRIYRRKSGSSPTHPHGFSSWLPEAALLRLPGARGLGGDTDSDPVGGRRGLRCCIEAPGEGDAAGPWITRLTAALGTAVLQTWTRDLQPQHWAAHEV